MGLRSWLDGQRTFQLGQGFGQPIASPQHERQVVPREAVAGVELQQLPEGLDCSLDSCSD